MRETFELVASQGLAVSRYHLIPRAEPPRVHQAPGMVDIAPTVAEIIQESPRPGGCRKVEDKDASSEQGVSVRVSQVRTLKAGSSFQKSHPCDPLSKDIFHLTGQQGTCPEQQPYPRKSRGRTFWVTENLVQSRRQQNGETLSRTEKGQASSVKSGQSHMSKKACTRQEDAEDLASSGLVPHRAAHNGKKPRRSTECDEAFHTAQGDYKCSQCGEAFSDKDECVQHQKVHTEEKSCKCSECGELFSHSSDFLLHEKTHSKPTPSESNNHGECFSFDSSPRIQQASHMGLRPNECAEYGRSFSTKYNLVQHQTSHTGAKPYECSECGKAFGRRSTLTRHQEIHCGKKAFRVQQLWEGLSP
ncbi:zinc finger protein 772-like [Manis pentadactyla]|uniref:zinc finger protein 772-like n=1 Tax=Manis pentadactyla TaxID=143292 RepID=UPI00255C99C2|nr:zinc finger protein 772-like [Manis pentadactyla]XP_057351534.1 zinc finger protein 772-like [Manis pentadactyla]XP_057351535.1 zinc finger protein 772-like [Manis pentadactyla]XP_057351536.1 zinc finger protein 772-like [Manis pentadactyla]XP_057351537.1 zinc finger protein 772-like [Manis pentadactyla]XP_057351538.1 zinc finger protein 772-like [Manis pentadactyla]XP_057351539.1 zinc finger protein 772-like [Manis pentadactyla]XP_057351540.1 zinc finger protein 772-like [Manis pentadact